MNIDILVENILQEFKFPLTEQKKIAIGLAAAYAFFKRKKIACKLACKSKGEMSELMLKNCLIKCDIAEIERKIEFHKSLLYDSEIPVDPHWVKKRIRELEEKKRSLQRRLVA